METAINKVYSLLEPLTLKRLHTREQEDNEVNKTSGKYKWLKEKKRRRKDRKNCTYGEKKRERGQDQTLRNIWHNLEYHQQKCQYLLCFLNCKYKWV